MIIIVLALITGCQPTVEDSLTGLSPEQQKQKLYDQIEAKYEVPRAHYQLGLLYRNERNFDRAAYHFNTSAEFLPLNWPAQAALVRAYRDDNKPDRAGQASAKWIQRTTTADQAISLARAFETEQLPTAALQSYERAMSLAPQSPAVYKQLGYYYLRRNDKVNAEKQFRRSFELDPYQADVSAELGKMGVIVQSPRKNEPGFFDWLFGNNKSGTSEKTVNK